METAALRRGGVQVTRLALGCAPLGGLYEAVSDDVAHATVDAAWDAGIRFIDTAPLYGFGVSGFDFSRVGVLRSFEESLRRLGLDRIDVVLIHDPDDHMEQALREAYPALDDLRRQRLVGRSGSA